MGHLQDIYYGYVDNEESEIYKEDENEEEVQEEETGQEEM